MSENTKEANMSITDYRQQRIPNVDTSGMVMEGEYRPCPDRSGALRLINPPGLLGDMRFGGWSSCGRERGWSVGVCTTDTDGHLSGGVLTRPQVRALHAYLGKCIEAFDANEGAPQC